MSFFSGLPFFSYLAAVLIPAIIIGLTGSRYLRFYRYFATILFIFLVYQSDVTQLLWMAGYAVLCLYVVKGYLWGMRRNADSPFLLGSLLALVLAPLIIYKVGATFFESSLFGFLGISYICFRVVQVILEIHDGLITEVRALQFLQFLLFFPSLSSGPIDRFRRFVPDDEKVYSRQEYTELLRDGLFKLIQGAFYKIVCSQICYEWMTTLFSENYAVVSALGHIYTYGLYLFFDFAGYSFMAVGTAYILGIRLPDNFHYPFISRDIKDFWNRWHITLSHWFRDYIFNRFLMNAIRRKWFKNRLNAACMGFVINMMVMGIWHGLDIQYLEYGLYHGLLLAGTEYYQKKSKFYKKHKNQIWFKVVSWFITINLVMIGFSIFSGYLNDFFNAWMKVIFR